MIVKLVIHAKLDAISIWNKEGDRLFYSDKPDDIQMAKNLLTVIKKQSDKELMHNAAPQMELKMSGYFNACWRNKIVQLMKRATGYTW